MAKKNRDAQVEQASDTDAMTDPGVTTGEATGEAKSTKSIVPKKYAGKYKDGGSDELAVFIKAQCKDDKGEFSFPAFFDLCRKNGLPEEKVAHYEGQVAEKRNGSQGRARMTLRNMLATIARKNGSLTTVNGDSFPISLPKPAVSGAAKKQQEASEGDGAQSSL